MQNKIQKRYIVLGIIIVLVGILVWHVSSSYALMDIGFKGKNIVAGDKWGINIVDIEKPELTGNAIVQGDISSIATTLNLSVSLFKPGDKISFNFTVKNTGKLAGELYALTLSGLGMVDSEVINYSIRPIDSSVVHDDKNTGSIIKTNEEQKFNVTIEYLNDSANNNFEHQLNLGSTIIYKQK